MEAILFLSIWWSCSRLSQVWNNAPVRPLVSFKCDQYFRGIKPWCLVFAHIASHRSPIATCKCLNEPLGQLMINGISQFSEECLFEQCINTQNNRNSEPYGILMCEIHVKRVPAQPDVRIHPSRLLTLWPEVHKNRRLQINAPPMSYLCQLLTMNGFGTVKARCINLLRLPLSWLLLAIDLPFTASKI